MSLGAFVLILSILCVMLASASAQIKTAPKEYACVEDTCQLQSSLSNQAARSGVSVTSQAACLIVCGGGSIWPYPNGQVRIAESLAYFIPSTL